MTHRPALLFAVLSAILLAAVGCRGVSWSDDDADRAELARFGAERSRAWQELKRQKGEIAWDYSDPLVFDFGDHGQVTVREWFLEGGPGWEYVRARITYRNTSTQPLDRIKVVLSVLDGEGEPVSASRVVLSHPWGLPLESGRFFSDEIKVPTVGAHRRPDGWHWQFDVHAVPWYPTPEIPAATQISVD